MGTLTIYLVESNNVINDVPLDAIQYWVDMTNKWAIVTGYKFEVIYGK